MVLVSSEFEYSEEGARRRTARDYMGDVICFEDKLERKTKEGRKEIYVYYDAQGKNML